MGMMVLARRVESTAGEVRYEFGFDDRFDRILTIDHRTLAARVDDDEFDAAASAITAKIVGLLRAAGEFPERAVFAS